MANQNRLSKRELIQKSNTAMLVSIIIAATLVVFSLVTTKSLLGQRNYQSKVIREKEIALKQLKQNVENAGKLVDSYKNFVEADVNAIGGRATGNTQRDGDNAKIILDALPSKYDFPALATSLDNLLAPYKNVQISGTDDELAQSQNGSSPNPEPVEIPIQISAGGDFNAIKNLFITLEQSIRPIQIRTLNISAADKEIQVNMTAVTYYQPEKNLEITKKEVK